MKDKFWYTWITALFLFASTVHGRELQYRPHQPLTETPVSDSGGRSNIPLIVCSSVVIAVIIGAIVHKRKTGKLAKRPAIVYHAFKGELR